ncbi:MAG: hypothetical protein Kow0031_04220 [Anaerolineae bacterium]
MQSTIRQQPPAPLTDEAADTTEYSDTLPLPLAGMSAAMTSLRQNWRLWQARLADDELLRNRVLTHGAMLLAVLAVIGLGRFGLPWSAITAIKPIKYAVDEPAPNADEVAEGAPLTLPEQLNQVEDGVLVRAAVPRTTILDQAQPEQAIPLGGADTGIRTYFVETGDTLTSIAQKFGLRAETLIWSNLDLEQNPDFLSVGQELKILPVDGVYHQVGGSDTIEGIASTFKTNPQLILDMPANQLDPDNPIIQPGQWLIVPGGSKPFKPRAVRAFAYSGTIPDNALLGTGSFGWPASGSISQGFFGYHPGLDIAAWEGAAVLAADSGYVIASGWDNSGYGISVVVDHGNGYQTLYAHLSNAYVTAGTSVSKGEQLGEMGCTGNCTGPHLHFEVRNGTVQRNPYGFLP